MPHRHSSLLSWAATRLPIPLAILCALAAACGDEGEGTGAPDATFDASITEADAASSRDPNGPLILSVGSNITRLTTNFTNEVESVVFSVVATDPDGIDDLIGGQLVDPGGGVYGSLATASAEGSYQIEVSWDDINRVRPIHVPVGGGERAFRILLFDQAGHQATEDVLLELACEFDGLAACDGECTNVSRDNRHCGSCETSCNEWGEAANLPDSFSPYCNEAQCAAMTERQIDEYQEVTCSEECAQATLSCVDGAWSTSGGFPTCVDGTSPGCAGYRTNSSFSAYYLPVENCTEAPDELEFNPTFGRLNELYCTCQ